MGDTQRSGGSSRAEIDPRVEALVEREIKSYQSLSSLAQQESLRIIHIHQSAENISKSIKTLMEKLGIAVLYFDPANSQTVLPDSLNRAEAERFLQGNSKVFDVSFLERLSHAVSFVLMREFQVDAKLISVVFSSQKKLQERAPFFIPIERKGNVSYAALDWNEALLKELMAKKSGDVERFVGCESLIDSPGVIQSPVVS